VDQEHFDDFERRLALIENRNKRVESDKAWETGNVRRVTLTCFTYIVAVAYGIATDIQPAWLHAAVPAAGFLLSTLTLSVVKERWLKRRES